MQRYDFKPTIEAFIRDLKPQDAYQENRAGMSASERLYEELFHKKPVEQETTKRQAA